MRCSECTGKGEGYVATWWWLDSNPPFLNPLCSTHMHDLIHMFGENNLDHWDINDLDEVVRRVNEHLEHLYDFNRQLTGKLLKTEKKEPQE